MKKTSPVAAPAHDARDRQRRTADEMATLKADMLAHARELFRSRGHAAVSIRAMTEHFGISPMTFYGYFPNKQALMACLWADVFRELFDKLLDASRHARQPWKALAAHVDIWMAHWEDNPALYRLIYMSGGDSGSGAPVDFGSDPVYEQLLSLGYERVSACAPGQDAAEDTVRLVLDLVFVQALGYLHATIGVARYPFVNRARLRRLLLQEMMRTAGELLASPETSAHAGPPESRG